jgi:hypothetical protein
LHSITDRHVASNYWLESPQSSQYIDFGLGSRLNHSTHFNAKFVPIVFPSFSPRHLLDLLPTLCITDSFDSNFDQRDRFAVAAVSTRAIQANEEILVDYQTDPLSLGLAH